MSHQLHTHTGRFITGEKTFSTNWIGGWVGPRAGLDAVKKKKNLTPARQHTLAFQPVASRYID
jgi:hypothetical protein